MLVIVTSTVSVSTVSSSASSRSFSLIRRHSSREPRTVAVLAGKLAGSTSIEIASAGTGVGSGVGDGVGVGQSVGHGVGVGVGVGEGVGVGVGVGQSVGHGVGDGVGLGVRVPHMMVIFPVSPTDAALSAFASAKLLSSVKQSVPAIALTCTPKIAPGGIRPRSQCSWALSGLLLSTVHVGAPGDADHGPTLIPGSVSSMNTLMAFAGPVLVT